MTSKYCHGASSLSEYIWCFFAWVKNSAPILNKNFTSFLRRKDVKIFLQGTAASSLEKSELNNLKCVVLVEQYQSFNEICTGMSCEYSYVWKSLFSITGRYAFKNTQYTIFDNEIHRVSKTVHNCFCHNFVKFPTTLIIFGTLIAQRMNLCDVHLFSTSPNSRQRPTYRVKCGCSKLLHNSVIIM